MTQEVDGFHLGGAALFQESLRVAEQLEDSGSAHAELRVVERVEAYLPEGQKMEARPPSPPAVMVDQAGLTWFTGLLELLVLTVANTLCFSHNQKISVHSGGPVWPIRYLESGEKAMQTNSWAGTSPAVRTFLFLPCSWCRSTTVMVGLSPRSDTARYRRLALRARAHMPWLFSEPVETLEMINDLCVQVSCEPLQRPLNKTPVSFISRKEVASNFGP